MANAASAAAAATAHLDADIAELLAKGEADAHVFVGTPLHACALQILRDDDVERKAALSFAVAAAFARGLVPIGGRSADAVPDRPARPEHVALVHPAKVKSSSRKHMLHSLVHAESFAIDLSWDVLARFGWSPELWHALPPPAGPVDLSVASATTAPPVASAATTALESAGAAVANSAAAAAVPAERMPDEFFATWVRVAAEEAKHFSKWRMRLDALHVSYGDLPAHDGLWQSAADTAHSLCARLSVVHCVHEARGLDVYDLMRTKLGDDGASVAVLDANHLEEITHVAAGRFWLERLCEATGRDPRLVFQGCVRAFFFGQLRPPFNFASRDKAGLTLEWWGPLRDKADGLASSSAYAELDTSDIG